jgi:Ala-tRNA(Pro) deacylase
MELQIGESEATRRILAHLDSSRIPYEKLEHEPVTTSEAAAGARATRIEQGAKALIVKAEEGQYHHLIISAALRVDNNKLRKIIGTKRIRFATADEVWQLTGCRPGAVPPFGNLFGLPVLMDDALLAEDSVYFNCGSHTVSLRMTREDLVKATGARVEDFH